MKRETASYKALEMTMINWLSFSSEREENASYCVVYLETIREGCGHVTLLLCLDHFKLYRVPKDY
jgi:hypothetical protein